MPWMWIAFIAVVLAISTLVGLHLGRFRAAYTEMTGMMAGMTMGMLNGFLLGYAAGAATLSMFWGNLFGLLLGLFLGVYFGRAGGLMGIMDGGMGGVMGGSMGAMLAVMVAYPPEAIYWTALLLGVVYLLGIFGLVALIEQSDPEHAALHRILPVFTRAVATEALEASAKTDATSNAGVQTGLKITDYYTFLGIGPSATAEEMGDAYLAKLAVASEAEIEQAEMAIATLTDPRKREIYDRRLQDSLAANGGRPDCCPPPRKKKAVALPAEVKAETLPVSAPLQSNRTATKAVRVGSGRVPGRTNAPGKRTSASRKIEQKELPISWVGVLAGAVAVVLLAGWWLVGQGTSGGTAATLTSQQADSQAMVIPVGADGKQTLDFVVNGYNRSYEPKAIKVKKDVPVHFNISNKGPDAGCSRYIAIYGLDVHGVAIKDRATALDFTPTKTGTFEINCEMRMTTPSYLIVTD